MVPKKSSCVYQCRVESACFRNSYAVSGCLDTQVGREQS